MASPPERRYCWKAARAIHRDQIVIEPTSVLGTSAAPLAGCRNLLRDGHTTAPPRPDVHHSDNVDPSVFPLLVDCKLPPGGERPRHVFHAGWDRSSSGQNGQRGHDFLGRSAAVV